MKFSKHDLDLWKELNAGGPVPQVSYFKRWLKKVRKHKIQ